MKVRPSRLNRRQFAMGVAAGMAAAGLPIALVAQDASQGWEQAVKKVLAPLSKAAKRLRTAFRTDNLSRARKKIAVARRSHRDRRDSP